MQVVPIPGIPFYGVSADGSVWSKKHRSGGEAAVWRKLKSRPHPKTRYHCLTLRVAGSDKTFLVHYLVAITFHGPRPEGYEINHKSGDKNDNSANNLEYLPYLKNLEHAWENNLIVVGKPKLTQEQVDQIREMKVEGESQPFIARCFDIGQPAVSDIVNFRTWKTRKVG